MPLTKDHHLILGTLSARGLVSSDELQRITGKSQASVSRLLSDLSDQILVLGRARATRYGLPKSIRGMPSQQPLYWTHEDGQVQAIGMLTLLADGMLHVEGEFIPGGVTRTLPWFLTPLHVQGFLGRLQAQRMASLGLSDGPQNWNVEDTLFVATHLHDPPGAITVGGLSRPETLDIGNVLPDIAADGPAALDALAADVANTLPAGSSAGGEQPKFIARGPERKHVLVKFSPPRGTPFGDRWSDLLHAEALASTVLGQHGVPVAQMQIVESATRTFLISSRFDRIGKLGRKHAVSVGAAHAAFVAGSYGNWESTCRALASQRRLGGLDADRAAALLAFGRLIGNADMHSGNLALMVELKDLARGSFSLAPVYDMLPMRWRPSPSLGGAPDYAPFDPDPISLAGPARGPALAFWSRLAGHAPVSEELRSVAAEMARRMVSAPA